MGNTMLERIAIDKYVVPFNFQTTNIGDADGTMAAIEPSCTEYVMPFSGTIIGLAVGQNAALSTGTLTFKPTKNGTAVTPTTLNCALSSSAQRAYKSQDADVAGFSFAAGDRIGVAWTKSGTVSATTTDAVATLWVLVKLDTL